MKKENKIVTVNVELSIKNGDVSASYKALHNGKYVIAKGKTTGVIEETVFKDVIEFIEQNKADNVNVKKGLIEDRFIKYFENHSSKKELSEESSDQQPTEDNLDASHSTKEYEDPEEDFSTELLLEAYKKLTLDAVVYADYESMLQQGALYEMARQEEFEESGKLLEPFDMQISVPEGERKAIIDAAVNYSASEVDFGFEELGIRTFKRRIEITRTNYKLAINFTK